MLFFMILTLDVPLTIGTVGMVFILLAFLMNQLHRWSDEDLLYDVCNMIGGLLLLWYAWIGLAWPFLVLNGVWSIYSIIDVVHDLQRGPLKRRRRPVRPR